MPKIQKAARIAAKRRMRNKSIHSATKTYIAKAEKFIAAKELDNAQRAVTQAISALDKAAQKRIIHPRNAARRKSRLMKKLHKVEAG
jgi:small subunit ribosomal protein S20